MSDDDLILNLKAIAIWSGGLETEPKGWVAEDLRRTIGEITRLRARVAELEGQKAKSGAMTAKIDRAELRRLCEAATPGPWFLRTNRHPTTDGRDWGWLDYQRGSASCPPGVRIDWEAGTKSYDNACFVADARTALPALLNALEEEEAKTSALNGDVTELGQKLKAAEARERKLREALSTIESTLSAEITTRFGEHPGESEYERGRKSVIYSLLVVPRNIARTALAKTESGAAQSSGMGSKNG